MEMQSLRVSVVGLSIWVSGRHLYDDASNDEFLRKLSTHQTCMIDFQMTHTTWFGAVSENSLGLPRSSQHQTLVTFRDESQWWI